MTLALVDEALASGARLKPICKVLGISTRSIDRWRALGEDGGEDRRHGPHATPKNALSKVEQDAILDVVNSPEFRDLSPKQIVPRLADLGLYVGSESTLYRVLAKAGQNTHRQPTKPATRNKPKQTIADGPGQVLCWDITYLPGEVRGKFYYLYVFLDIWSRKIVGWGVHEEQCGEFAASLLEATCDRLGTCAVGARLHSDNGSPMKGSTMLSTMQWLGIVPSFSRPNVSDDNPFVESIFRTLKYRPGTPARFTSLADAVAWVDKLVRWYNFEHLHSGIGFVTPEDRHTGADVAILLRRRAVYRKANKRHPERWTGNVRAWGRPETVTLHPDRPAITLQPRRGAAA